MNFRKIPRAKNLETTTNHDLNTADYRNSNNLSTHNSFTDGAPCLKLRSASANTALTVHTSKIPPTQLPRHRESSHQACPPLSAKSSHDHSSTHLRKSSPVLRGMAVASTRKAQTHSDRVRRRHSGRSDLSPSISRLSTRLLLSQARRTMEAQTDWQGRGPTMMDVILDLKAPVSHYRDAKLTDVVDPTEQLRSFLYREYAFKDQQSLDSYWADQAIIWSYMRPIESVAFKFPDSCERSTASWAFAVNKEAELDCTCDLLFDK